MSPGYSPESTAIPEAEGVEIRAGDGRMWRFAGPGVRYRPKRVKVEAPPLIHYRTEMEVVWDLPIEVKRPLADALAAAGARDDRAVLSAVFRMAVPMIRACHDLTDEQLSEVLEFGPDVDGFAASLLNVAMGLPPTRGMEPEAPGPADDPDAPIPLAGDELPGDPSATTAAPDDQP